MRNMMDIEFDDLCFVVSLPFIRIPLIMLGLSMVLFLVMVATVGFSDWTLFILWLDVVSFMLLVELMRNAGSFRRRNLCEIAKRDYVDPLVRSNREYVIVDLTRLYKNNGLVSTHEVLFKEEVDAQRRAFLFDEICARFRKHC